MVQAEEISDYNLSRAITSNQMLTIPLNSPGFAYLPDS